jgi:hypothetical protein
METTANSPQILESSRARKRKGPARQTWSESGGSQGPWRPSRRNLLIGSAAVAVAAIFGVKHVTESGKDKPPPIATSEKTPSKPNPYLNWEKYRNGQLPKELLITIGESLD